MHTVGNHLGREADFGRVHAGLFARFCGDEAGKLIPAGLCGKAELDVRLEAALLQAGVHHAARIADGAPHPR